MIASAAGWPDPALTVADLAAIEACATRAETPCGDAAMVWRLWGAGAPVLLLHGGSGSWTHWVRNIAALARAGRRVCVPDLPGFGDSAPPPAGDDADVLPQWVEAGLRTLLGDAQCDVAGFSFGAMVAGFLAAREPQRVRRLVLVGAPALSATPMAALHLRAWDRLPAGPRRDAAHRHNLRSLMLTREESIDALALALHAANLERDRMRKRRLSQTDVLLRTLPLVTCPLWGIWGAEDAIYRGRSDAILPGLSRASNFRSLTLIPGAGHWVQYEAAAVFNQALAAILETPI